MRHAIAKLLKDSAQYFELEPTLSETNTITQTGWGFNLIVQEPQRQAMFLRPIAQLEMTPECEAG